MAIYINQAFTGTNGSAPSNLMNGLTPSGGSVSIQSNRARFYSGTAGTNDRLSRAFTVDGSTALSLANISVTIDYIPTANHFYPGVVLRSSQSFWQGDTGYIFEVVNNNTVYITRAISYTYTTLASAPYSFTIGTSYTWQCVAFGSSLRFYINGTLVLNTTDTSLSSGFGLLTTNGLNAGSSDIVDWDNLIVEDSSAIVSTTMRNTAEGQASGTTVTPANSGGGSGTAFSNVSVTGSATRIFSNTAYMHGTQSYALTPSGSTSVFFTYDNQTDMGGAQQAYFYFTAYPSGTTAMLATYSTDTKSTLAITSAGGVNVYDDAGQIASSASGIIPLNRWIRFDMVTTIGTSATTGRIQAKVSLEDNSDALFSYDSGIAVDVGTVAITSYRFGKIDATPTLAVFYVDDITAKTSTTSYIDPINDQLRRNTAEGQPDGTTLSAANSGGGSGTAFDTVTVSGTVARTFSNEQKMFGSQSYKIAASASSAIYNRVNTADVYSGAAQMYLYLPAYADANQLFVNIRSTSASIAAFSVNQTGAVVISNSAGSNLIISSGGIFPTNQWIRADLAVIVGTSTSNGRITAQLSTMNSFTPFWTYDSGYTTNTGTASFAEFRFGKLDTTPNISLFYFDDAAWRPKLLDFIPGQSSSPGVAWFVA